MRFLATCTFGLESVLKKEIKNLGLWYEEVGDGYVAFSGEEQAMSIANLWLRTADRVFLELATFPAHTFEELFQGVFALPWSQYIALENSFPVLAKSRKSQLSSTPSCQSITKKAIVKKLQEHYQIEQFMESGAEVGIHVWLLDDQAKVLLNTSGAALHKRGYRDTQVAAPLKETLAAGLVYLSDWDQHQALYDPFCGSGTILIEAAMLAKNIAPGLLRTFAFEQWSWPNKTLLVQARAEAQNKKSDKSIHIRGSDYDPEAIAAAKHSASLANVPEITFEVADILNSEFRIQNSELILTNPPYGHRLGDEYEVREIYHKLEKVYRDCMQARWHIFTAYPDIERDFKKQAKRRKLYNGGIQCYLYSF
ncbi:MAG: class I SAM-dependent RNA methyltransferase [Candidatus Abawacabacteria bacterium]|nr:class I SAM-dependent RNA methyltransferase [Candidatus Abawacabacteria bacterium]